MHLRALHHLKNNIFNFLTFKKKLTPLCKIAFKYDTDKGKHRYTYYYHKLFKDSRKKSINILELGIYKGHSIKMWDEYFEKVINYEYLKTLSEYELSHNNILYDSSQISCIYKLS